MIAYNDNYQNYMKEFLSQMQDFSLTEDYFKDIHNSRLRAYKNASMEEPYK